MEQGEIDNEYGLWSLGQSEEAKILWPMDSSLGWPSKEIFEYFIELWLLTDFLKVLDMFD